MTEAEQNKMNNYLDTIISRLDTLHIDVTVESVFQHQTRYSRSAIARWLKKYACQ